MSHFDAATNPAWNLEFRGEEYPYYNALRAPNSEKQ